MILRPVRKKLTPAEKARKRLERRIARLIPAPLTHTLGIEGPPLPYALETLHRLPLADDDFLDQLFEEHRGRCYRDVLSFSQLTHVLADALTQHHGSGRQAIRLASEQQRLDSQPRAVYRKLGRLPLALSQAFLSACVARLRPLFPAAACRHSLPVSLSHFTVTVIDGKVLKDAAKRLLPTRGQPGKLYGGKILAAYLPQDGLVVAMSADEDGEANDIRLIPGFLPLARAATPDTLRLWVADSQFCDLDQPELFTQEGDRFLLRFTQRNGFHPDEERPAQEGTDRLGRRVLQEWGFMGAQTDERRRYVRRITLFRPGEDAVVLVTDLLEEGLFPVQDLLDAYLTRWQIENVYQQITEVFGLRHLIGSSPRATVFQAALCLVIYDAMQLIRSYVALGQSPLVAVDDVSTEMLFVSVRRQMVGLHETLTVGELLPCLCRRRTADQVREHLAALLGSQWSPLWLKARNKKPRSHPKKERRSGAHSSVHKVLRDAKKGVPTKRSPKEPIT